MNTSDSGSSFVVVNVLFNSENSANIDKKRQFLVYVQIKTLTVFLRTLEICRCYLRRHISPLLLIVALCLVHVLFTP